MPNSPMPVMRWDHRPEAGQWTEATLDALRTGHGTYSDWQHVTSWINILAAVNDKGVIRGMLPYIEQIEAATRAIYARAAGGGNVFHQLLRRFGI